MTAIARSCSVSRGDVGRTRSAEYRAAQRVRPSGGVGLTGLGMDRASRRQCHRNRWQGAAAHNTAQLVSAFAAQARLTPSQVRADGKSRETTAMPKGKIESGCLRLLRDRSLGILYQQRKTLRWPHERALISRCQAWTCNARTRLATVKSSGTPNFCFLDTRACRPFPVTKNHLGPSPSDGHRVTVKFHCA